jgi:hypothetical protein
VVQPHIIASGQDYNSSASRGINMKWEFVLHENEKYLEVITEEVADKKSSLGMAKEISIKMRQNRVLKVLIDHSHLEGVTGEIIDIYNRPKLFSIIGMMLNIKIAEIIRPEHVNHFRFLETVFINNGFTIVIYQDRKPALEWLLK